MCVLYKCNHYTVQTLLVCNILTFNIIDYRTALKQATQYTHIHTHIHTYTHIHTHTHTYTHTHTHTPHAHTAHSTWFTVWLTAMTLRILEPAVIIAEWPPRWVACGGAGSVAITLPGTGEAIAIKVHTRRINNSLRQGCIFRSGWGNKRLEGISSQKI